MEATFYKAGKTQTQDIDTGFLGDVVRVRLLKQAVRMYRANLRQGTHKTKSRGELPYRKAALFRQKGTGRARVRHPQAVQCRSGGVVHGPRPRDYSYSIPLRARREALKSALLSKFRDGEVAVVDGFSFDQPSTKDMARMIGELGFDGATCLIAVHETDDNLLLSARNLKRITVTRVEDLNAYELLLNKNLIITEGALEKVREKTSES